MQIAYYYMCRGVKNIKFYDWCNLLICSNMSVLCGDEGKKI